jgi:hypothetical protein
VLFSKTSARYCIPWLLIPILMRSSVVSVFKKNTANKLKTVFAQTKFTVLPLNPSATYLAPSSPKGFKDNSSVESV